MVAVATLVAACSRNEGRTLRPPRASDQTLSVATTTTTVARTQEPSVDGSSEDPVDDQGSDGAGSDLENTATLLAPWVNGEAIPDVYTCKGGAEAPSLVWRGVAAGAVEQALVMTDVDANGFVHWLVAGIPPTVSNLDPADIPSGAVIGRTPPARSGYAGPCPTASTDFLSAVRPGAPFGVTSSTPAADAVAAVAEARGRDRVGDGYAEPESDRRHPCGSLRGRLDPVLYGMLELPRRRVRGGAGVRLSGTRRPRHRPVHAARVDRRRRPAGGVHRESCTMRPAPASGTSVTAPSHRRRGLAERLVRHAVASTPGPIVLDAQSPLVAWYAAFGVRGDRSGIRGRRDPPRTDAAAS